MIPIHDYDNCHFVNYVINSDISFYEIGEQVCPASYSYGPSIRNHYIFHYVYKGSGTLRLDDRSYTVHEGQGFLITPNALSYYEADQTNPWHYAWIHLGGAKVTEYLGNAGLSLNNPIFIPNDDSKEIYDVMMSICDNYPKELYCTGKLYEFFELITTLSTATPTQYVDERLVYIKKILDYIHIKYCDDIHMDDISRVCGLERSYMTKLFKHATGQTPQDYLFSYRMEQAKRMLKKSDISVRNIAYSVGYSDGFTFSKAFKRYTNLSPSEYRQSIE